MDTGTCNSGLDVSKDKWFCHEGVYGLLPELWLQHVQIKYHLLFAGSVPYIRNLRIARGLVRC